jgi:peptidyl-prolyl cis-trans isomerase A (cyclophilin A)
MQCRKLLAAGLFVSLLIRLNGAPIIDPISAASIPAGKSLTLPITASSPNGRPLAYAITSSTNRITVEIHTNNPFWKMSVVQVTSNGAPGAFQTPFRGAVVTVTNLGDMTFMLFRDRAPKTVDVFQGLTASGLYTSNTVFHRVIPGFMIQGGDPQTNGSGGPVFRYDDEFHPRAIFSGNGQLALANSGKDTCGSQFFVTQGPQRFLDFGYTLFGQLLRGFNVQTNVLNTPRNASDRPLADVIITRASFVTNYTDTVITLTGTNLAGVSGTIQVIADDGTAGGRTTNTFTATTVSDAANNDNAFLKTPAFTNLFLVSGTRTTNYIQAQDLEGNALYYFVQYADAITSANATNANYYADGGLAFSIVPGYVGPLKFYVYTSQYSDFTSVNRPYDQQVVTFAVGDTVISALATNLITQPLLTFSNQVLATFTNGVANSPTGNFTASINWGDNSLGSGLVTSNLNGRKEIRGTHTYTNSGQYPVYVTIQSVAGAESTVVATAHVQPSLFLTRNSNTTLLRWPAWASDYAVQANTNLATSSWLPLTNLPSLSGYENGVTNVSTDGTLYFRLKR